MQPQFQEPHELLDRSYANIEEWFAVLTRPRHEKRVALELKEKGIVTFLPLYTAVNQWSDRKQQVQLPLFPNYIFVRIVDDRSRRSAVLQTNGVRSFVGMRGIGVCIPDEEIEMIEKVLTSRLRFTTHPFLNIGQKVQIRGGSLDGVRGILTAVNNDRSLIISVDCIQKSIAIRIDGCNVKAA